MTLRQERPTEVYDPLVVKAAVTEERSYTTMDKSGWGDGPWSREVDKLQFVDPATGLDCLIVRSHTGALCGYVGIGPDHPWHGHAYNMILLDGSDDWGNSPEGILEVHGGITYSDLCQEGSPEESGICHVARPGEPERLWWFGFDCNHAWDFAPRMHADLAEIVNVQSRWPRVVGVPNEGEEYRTIAYVREQCALLAAQLAAVATSS